MRFSLIALFFVFSSAAFCQGSAWDTLNIQYQLLQTNYSQYEDVIKIKVPPFLSTAEVMRQVKLAVSWPGDPLPRKKVKVYVFRDDAPKDAKSSTGVQYSPRKGFQWDMAEWEPDTSMFSYEPSMLDKLIYESYVDSILANGMESQEIENSNKGVKTRVAEDFNMTPVQLDSVFYRVKWWAELKRKR